MVMRIHAVDFTPRYHNNNKNNNTTYSLVLSKGNVAEWIHMALVGTREKKRNDLEGGLGVRIHIGGLSKFEFYALDFTPPYTND